MNDCLSCNLSANHRVLTSGGKCECDYYYYHQDSYPVCFSCHHSWLFFSNFNIFMIVILALTIMLMNAIIATLMITEF